MILIISVSVFLVKKRLLLVSISLMASPAYGADMPSIYDLTLKELMEVSVITAASGFEQALERAPSNATVITREQWQVRGVNTLSQALEVVAGVHITEPLVNFNHNIYMIRGLAGSDGEKVKLLIDGSSIEWMQTSGRPLGFEIPLNLFERIEVVKGPGSVIYGADAFAGVINLVSRSDKKFPFSVRTGFGSFNNRALALSGSLALSEHQVDLAVDYLKGDDDPSRVINNDLQTTLDGIFGTSASYAPGPIDERHELLAYTLNWRWQDFSANLYSWHNFDVGIGAGIAQALDPHGKANASSNRLTLRWDLAAMVKQGQLELSTEYQKNKLISYLYVFPEGSVLPVGSDGNVQFSDPVGLTRFSDGLIGTPSNVGEVYSAKLTRLNKMDDHLIRWELGFEYHDFHVFERKNFGPGVLDGNQVEVDGTLTDVTGTEFIYLPDKTRQFYYVSLLDEWDISQNAILSLGIRYDHYSDFGSTTNPRISFIYHSGRQFSTKLFVGSAFRAPSFSELYVRNNPVLQGNPELKPEGIKTYEAGFGIEYWVNDNLLISMDLFNYHADDLIDYIYDAELNYEVAQNIGVQNGVGGELSVGWKPEKHINMNVNYSFIRSKDRLDFTVARVPKQMLYMDVHYRFESNWRVFLDGKWIKGRERAVDDLRLPIKDYYRVNTTLTYEELLPGLDVSLALKNLFDRDARESSDGSIAEDYPQPGRHWSLTFDYNF